MAQTKSYAGILDEPLPRVDEQVKEYFQSASGEDMDVAAMQAIEAFYREYGERIRALYGHYEIKPLNWRGLALALAKEHVPGFSVRKSSAGSPRRGAPLKWTHQLEVQLLGEVAKLLLMGKNVDEACRELIRREPWRSLVGVSRRKTESVARWETLKRQYNRASKKYEDLTTFQIIDRMVRPTIFGQ
jgi:hypothetical protein